MSWILIYLMIGIVITATLDYLSQRNEDTELHFNNMERVIVVLFWPVAFGSFIINFIKHIIK